MTRRKPPGVSWETWIDRQIREAEEKGEFDNLPGKGKPIEGLDRPHDPEWWVKQLVRRENLSIVPPALELRKAVERALAEIAKEKSEREVRRLVAELNERIRALNARATSGPPTDVAPIDVERLVRRWRNGELAGHS
ncbi:MAG: DnaJ family domain-containing protein [Planctomycetota bacterium]|jgi:hypothetical protein